jgi:hypothetical protein
MVYRQLRDFKGGLPDKLMMFRDGVSEGEVDRVLELEVAAIKGKSPAIPSRSVRFQNGH